MFRSWIPGWYLLPGQAAGCPGSCRNCASCCCQVLPFFGPGLWPLPLEEPGPSHQDRHHFLPPTLSLLAALGSAACLHLSNSWADFRRLLVALCWLSVYLDGPDLMWPWVTSQFCCILLNVAKLCGFCRLAVHLTALCDSDRSALASPNISSKWPGPRQGKAGSLGGFQVNQVLGFDKSVSLEISFS